MGLELPCKAKVISYDPQVYSKRLGHKCNTCDVNLTHEKCISLCKCYLFCHQRCFISQFEPLLYDQDTIIECKACKDKVNINLETDYVYQPQKTFPIILKLVISILFLVLCSIIITLTIRNPIQGNLTFILLYFEGLALGIGLYMLAISIRDVLYRKVVTIKEIIPTRLEIQTSAFKDLDIETNEELTKDYLIFQSKKEKC